MKHYSDNFFSYRARGARSSAEVVVPLIIELTQPTSVIDVGCGTGEWLAVFIDEGVKDVIGVDGSYVSKNLLEIPRERFIPADLQQPFSVSREFDLVVCLEVAEHLPHSSAESFVKSLTKLGPVVMFSAAVPYQGGEHHINEQWSEYWVSLFNTQGYVATDALRCKIWYDERIEYWYIQNTLIFVEQSSLEEYPLLNKEYLSHNSMISSIIHPRLYLARTQEATLYYHLIHRPIDSLKRTGSNYLKNILPHGIYRLVHAAYEQLKDALRFNK